MSEFKKFLPVFIAILTSVTTTVIAIISSQRAKKDRQDSEE